VGSARYHYYLRLVLLIIDRAKSPGTRRQFRLVERAIALFNTRADLFPAGYRKPTERLRFGGAFPFSGRSAALWLPGSKRKFPNQAVWPSKSPVFGIFFACCGVIFA
jgi:hypothetical protein